MLLLDCVDPTDPGGDYATGAQRVVRQLALPAGVRERLRGRDLRKLREAVQPPDLLDRQELLGLELRAGAGAVDDPADAGRPALVQGRCADAKRRDSPDPGDRDASFHCGRPSGAHPDRLTISSIASPTALSSF